MSWDVLIVNRGGRIGPETEDEASGPLGPPDEVRRKIADALPGVDWSEPAWGVFETDEYTIDFNLGEDDRVETLMMHVGGGGDIASALVRLAEATNWSLLDTTTGEYINPHQPPAESWKASSTFRDEVTREVQLGLAEMTEGTPSDRSLPSDIDSTAQEMTEASEPELIDRAQPEEPGIVGVPEPTVPAEIRRPVPPSPRDARESRARRKAVRNSPRKKVAAKKTSAKTPPARSAKAASGKRPGKSAVRGKTIARGKKAPVKKKATKAVQRKVAKKAVKKAGRKLARGVKKAARKVAKKAARRR